MTRTFKALSLWQPWASLVVIGAKSIETRSWRTKYRGPLIIHAAKRWLPDQWAWLQGHWIVRERLFDAGYWVSYQNGDPGGLPFGAAVALVELVDCLPTERCTVGDLERECGDFSAGRWAWFFAKLKRLREPIPVKGQMRLFNLSIPVQKLRFA